MAIHQLLVGFRPGDAISNHAIALQKVLIDFTQKPSRIFGDSRHYHFKNNEYAFSPYQQMNLNKEDLLIYHYSIGSNVTDAFLKTNAKKMVYYHNITPPKYFYEYSMEKALFLEDGLNQLKTVLKSADFLSTASTFSASDIKKYTDYEVTVIPLLMDYSYLDHPLSHQRDPIFKVLFVGRIAPNKKIEDIILAFSMFQKIYSNYAQLKLVGLYNGMEGYVSKLKKNMMHLELNENIFTNYVNNSELSNHYDQADVFLCLSEHEGYCVPLVESMKMKVPIIALDRGAVKETLGGAGILINQSNPKYIAEILHGVQEDNTLKDQLKKHGYQRFQELDYSAISKQWKKYLTQVLQCVS